MTNLKMRVLPKFPARVDAGPGIGIERANGVYTISSDFEPLVPVPAPGNPAATWLELWQEESDSFGRFSVADLTGIISGNINVGVTLEAFGAVGNDATLDTAALAAAMAIPNAVVTGVAGREYYIAAGAVCAAGTMLKGVRLKVKIGPGGFDSIDWGASVRYDTDHCLLHWDGVDGGGLEDVEIFADTTANHRSFVGVAVTGGMSVHPFAINGRLMIRDISGVVWGVILNEVGDAGYEIDTMEFRNLGTTLTKDNWLNNGVEATFTQTTGFHTDDFGTGKRGRIQQVIGLNYIRGRDNQTDHVGLSGIGANDKGPHINYVYCDGVEEVCDIFCTGATIDVIECQNVFFNALKLIHGARYNTIGEVRGLGAIGRNLVGIYGADVSAGATEGNVVRSVTGRGVGQFVMNSGTLVSATSTTAVLAVGASPTDDFYPAVGSIRLLNGTGAPAEVPITDYVGSTRTITVASWPAGTPDSTTTYWILPFRDRAVVTIELPNTGGIKDNTVWIDGVRDDGAMNWIARNDLVDGPDNNQVIINRDMGFQQRPVLAGTAIYWAKPGPGARSVTRMRITSAQIIATTAATLINFDLTGEDSYRRRSQSAAQASPSELGIRVQLPGPKKFKVQLRYTTAVAGGNSITVSLLRNGAAIAVATKITVQTTNELESLEFDVYHREIWFGGNQNLYQVSVQHSSAGSHTITQSANDTWFSVTDG